MANLPETPQWQDGIYQIETSDPVLGGPDGISNRQAKQLASRTTYLKQQQEKSNAALDDHISADDPHKQYAPKASPSFTGTPTAPTAEQTTNNKQIATTAFVQAMATALKNGAPADMDTLKKLADAVNTKLTKDLNLSDLTNKALARSNLGLGNAAMRNVGTETGNVLERGAFGLGGKGLQLRGKTNADLMKAAKLNGCSFVRSENSGPSVPTYGAGFYSTVGDTNTMIAANYATAEVVVITTRDAEPDSPKINKLYGTANKPTAADVGALDRNDAPVGIPQPWPTTTAPVGWLKCNGATFDKAKYPLLTAAYPSGKLPDLRGEFVRGWDDGRGADSVRSLLSAQDSTLLRSGGMEYYGADESNVDGASGLGFANEDYILNSQPSGAKSPSGALQPTSGTLNDNAMIGRVSTSWIAEGSRWIALRPRNIAFNYIVRAA